MNYFVDVICDDKRVDKSDCVNIRSAIEKIVSLSGLLSSSTNCSGLYVIVNPDLSQYTNVEQITSRIFLKSEQYKRPIDIEILSGFKLYCIGLNAELFKRIEKILLIVETETLEDQTTGNIPTNDNTNPSNSEDDERPSYTSIRPMYTLENVILSTKTRSDIDRAISLIHHRDKIFKEWGFDEIDPHTKTILCFYGAPGTGKTMCAHALASKLEKSILIASYASIESKWVGEGPKNLQQIFKDATEQNAILFFDEADSFLSKRVANAETGSDKHYNRMSNEMFQLLENHDGVIIFATNMVSDFDKAFKSRILAFVEFELPDHNTRKQLICSMIPKKLPMSRPLSDTEISQLAELSDGFSGREIRKSVLTSLAEGAMHNVDSFSVKEFEVGFNCVKEDTTAIDVNPSSHINDNIIADFLNEADVNSHIMDICLYVVWQNSKPTASQMNCILGIAKILRCDSPDFTISYANKSLDEAIDDIVRNNRVEESLRYCVELLSFAECTSLFKTDILNKLCKMFGYSEPPLPYIKLLDVYEEIRDISSK